MNNIRHRNSYGSVISLTNQKSFRVRFRRRLLRKLEEKVNLGDLEQILIASYECDKNQNISITLDDVGHNQVISAKDFRVKCKVSMNEPNEATSNDFKRMIETIKENKSSGMAYIKDFFSLHISACFQGDAHSSSCFVDATFIHSRHEFKLTPIKPMTLAPSALLDGLRNPVGPMAGFLTFDAKKQLVPIPRCDDKVYLKPIVGVWIVGVDNINDVSVWANLLQYCLNRNLKSTHDRFFLLFSSNRYFEFFECTPVAKDPPPSFLTGHTSVLLKKNYSSLPDSFECLEMEKPSNTSRKFDMFMMTMDSIANAVQGQNYNQTRRVERNVFHDRKDVMSRPLLPLKEIEISTIANSSVPEFTMLLGESQYNSNHQKVTHQPVGNLWTSTPRNSILTDEKQFHNHLHGTNCLYQLKDPNEVNNQFNNQRSPIERNNFTNNDRLFVDNARRISDQTRNNITPVNKVAPVNKVTVADRLVASSDRTHQHNINKHLNQDLHGNKYLNQEKYPNHDKYQDHTSRGYQSRSPDQHMISPTTYHTRPNYQQHQLHNMPQNYHPKQTHLKALPQISSNQLDVSKNVTPTDYMHSNPIKRHNDHQYRYNDHHINVNNDLFKTRNSDSSPVIDEVKLNKIAKTIQQILNSSEPSSSEKHNKSDTLIDAHQSPSNAKIFSKSFVDDSIQFSVDEFEHFDLLSSSDDETVQSVHFNELDDHTSCSFEDTRRDMGGERDTNYKFFTERVNAIIGRSSNSDFTEVGTNDYKESGDELSFLKSEYGCHSDKFEKERKKSRHEPSDASIFCNLEEADNLTFYLSKLDKSYSKKTQAQSDKSCYFDEYAAKYEDDNTNRKKKVKSCPKAPSDASRYYNSFEQKYFSEEDLTSPRRYHH